MEAVAIATGALLLAACAPATKVSVAANASAQYSHVFVTVSAIWFNTDANATPDDAKWLKYPLSGAVTLDLASDSSDSLVQLAKSLNVTPGTYAQVRLLPLDSTNALAASAQSAGALYNAEADYVDSTGTSIRAPLELLNPTQGIGLTGTLKVPKGSSDNTDVPDAISLGLAFDASRDLVPLSDGSAQKVLFNPHGTALDLNLSGAIKGNVEVSVLKAVTTQNGRTNVQVTAETLSADGSRHQPVLTVPVRSDGSFTLYPLATDTATPAAYDLVIHGPALATVIVRAVTVAAGAVTASTTTSIGTIAPRDASSFNANLAPPASATLPAGAVARFYQTIPGAGEVPYAIDQAPIDPLTRKLATDLSLSDATIDVGSFVSSGTPITLTAQTQSEGAAVYKVAGSAPLYSDGAFSATVTTTGSSATATAAPATLDVASGAIATTLTAAVTQRTPAFDRGELILSHDGAIVDAVSLQSALTAGPGTITNVTLGNLPGGNSSTTFDSALYYLSIRVWSAANPAQTFQRDAFITPLDLRSAASATISLPVD